MPEHTPVLEMHPLHRRNHPRGTIRPKGRAVTGNSAYDSIISVDAVEFSMTALGAGGDTACFMEVELLATF